jgi:5-methylcytosine-specific restriction endonuclease McrA
MSRPRIRTIKPELWQDEKVGGLSRDARLLFIGLVTMADDEGRLRALPAVILGHCLPYDADALRKVETWLAEVAASGLVTRYVVDGTPYVQINGWTRHQVINRPTNSELPPAPGHTSEGAEPYKKKAIPDAVRRAVAKRYGAVPGEAVAARCDECGATGTIDWPRTTSGKPGSWVTFSGLELDHINPEFHGGEATDENLRLLCRRCNRSKGHSLSTESRDPAERNPVLTSSSSLVRGRAGADRIGSDQERKGPPLPPKGKRHRDALHFVDESLEWAVVHLPDCDPAHVIGAVKNLRAANCPEHEITPDRIRDRIRRTFPHLGEDAA